MAVTPADARAIVERVCTRPEVLGALTRRDLGMVITALGGSGMTQGRISELTGIPQGRLSEWKTGKREPKGARTFEKFANGLGLPSAARRALGLDSTDRPLASIPAPRIETSYPDAPRTRPGTSPSCGLWTWATLPWSDAGALIIARGKTPRCAGWSTPPPCLRISWPAAFASACQTWNGSRPRLRCSPRLTTASAAGTRGRL
jgi:transcriptional regulator with XRE-family HTH domain